MALNINCDNNLHVLIILIFIQLRHQQASNHDPHIGNFMHSINSAPHGYTIRQLHDESLPVCMTHELDDHPSRQINYPILQFTNFGRRFKLIADANIFDHCCVSTQEGLPICYASKRLKAHEKHYATVGNIK
uniref:Uncharacterized protein n=1 Tax=Glossina palpalis gambiensis TaxID=67801 RepID=A0A1B0BLJ0_9MUSC